MKNYCLGSILLVFLCLACSGEEFDPESLLTKLRVLAVKFEPPEILEGQESQMTMLVYAPESINYSVSYQLDPENRLGDSIKGSFVEGETQGAGVYTAPAAVASASGHLLMFEVAVQSDQAPIKARKRISIWSADRVAEEALNKNPIFSSIVFPQGQVASPVEIKKGKGAEASGLEVEAHVEGVDQDQDDLIFRWYSDHGRFKNFASRKTEWICDGAKESTRLIVVVRDLKGGVDWGESTVSCI